jgi:hypothetical protein
MARKPIHQIAVEVLRETDNPAVMYGDSWLLDEIFYRANGRDRPPHPLDRWKRVLDALQKSPGELVPGHTRLGSGRLVRRFDLPQPPRGA